MRTGLSLNAAMRNMAAACGLLIFWAIGSVAHANALGAAASCTVSPMTLGQQINGSLTSTDCYDPSGYATYADQYSFTATAGQQVYFRMESSSVDAYLILADEYGNFLESDDDGAGGTNSRIPAASGYFTLPGSGTYYVYATTSIEYQTGSYTLFSGTQFSGPSCSYTLASSSTSLGSGSGGGSIGLTSSSSSCNWSASTSSSWIHLTNPSGTGSATVTFTVDANTGTSNRTGSVSVGGQTYTVTQSGVASVQPYTPPTCTTAPLTLGQTTYGSLTSADCTDPTVSGTYYADKFSFTATAGQQVYFSMESADVDAYLSLFDANGNALLGDNNGGGGTNARIPANSGYHTLTNGGTYYLYATTNLEFQTGSYTLYSGTNSSPVACSYTLSSSSQSLGASSGSGSISLAANASSCTWNASTSESWIHLGNSGGTGNGTLSYNVDANTGTSSRSGTITVGGQTFVVTQAGMTACSQTLSQSNITLPASGGSTSVSLTSSSSTCSWNAIGGASWLSVSPVSGVGNGVIGLSAGANSTGVGSRTATLTIGSASVTVTQAEVATLSSLELSCPKTMPASSTGVCTASAVYSDGKRMMVSASNWTASPSATVSVDANGGVTAGAVSVDTAVKISATYSENGKTVTGTQTITVTAAACQANTGEVTVTGSKVKQLGESLEVRYRLCNFNKATYFDVYVAVQIPTGDMYFLSSSGSFFGTPTFTLWDGSKKPAAYLASTLVPDLEGTVLSMSVMPLTLPTGTYTFYAIPVLKGADVMNGFNWVGNLARGAVTLTK